jgi:DNA-binding NarL/FixJ family response regulator
MQMQGEIDCRPSGVPNRGRTVLGGAGSIRVLLVDDHFLVRIGLTALLQRTKRCEVVAEAGTGAEALKQFVRHHPDVTLLDRRLPDVQGEMVVARLRQEDPKARVIMLSIDEGEDDVHRALKAGASGYLSKSVSGAELLIAIEAALKGDVYVAEALRDRLESRQRRQELSSRELDVLRQVIEGRANKEIAVALGLSTATVKFHVGRILRKLGVEDRAQAMATALGRGLVHLDTSGPNPPADLVAST